ncbi:hypothetical protein BEL04_15375 [Mucilaginibacter sp. PPCGB 2223]|nr:hypothetical protein BEL04_15375 [Mucilaginibacter sp. PPCGB 2223]
MNMNNHIEHLYFKSKKTSLIVLAATAVICSRMFFFFFNDPEGPNLLIVTGFALAVYSLSAAAYLFAPVKITGAKRLSAVIFLQILSVTGLYFCMK